MRIRSRSTAIRGLGAAAVLWVAGFLVYRGLFAVHIVPLDQRQIDAIVGPDLRPTWVARGPFASAEALCSLSDDSLAVKVNSLAGSRARKVTDYASDIRESWRITDALTALTAGKALAPDPPFTRTAHADPNLDIALRRFGRIYSEQIDLEAASKDGSRCLVAAKNGLAYVRLVHESAWTGIIRYLVAGGCEANVMQSILAAAADGVFTYDQLCAIYADIPPAPAADEDLAEAARRDLTMRQVPYLLQLQRSGKKIGDVLFPDDGSNISDLVVGQLDAPATLQRMAALMREHIRNLSRPWAQRDFRGHDALQRSLAALPQPPDSQPGGPWYRPLLQKIEFKAKLRSVPNGLGLEAIQGPSLSIPIISARQRTRHEAERQILLLQAYESKHGGNLPDRLEDLASISPGTSLPTDLYSGRAFLYSRSRRIIWSVGENGVDDGGDQGPARYHGPDLVWPVP